VSLGAINYYFGTKDALVVAVFVRRLEPVNQERLQRLDRLEQKAGDRPLELEDVLSAFFEPIIHADTGCGLPRENFLRLISRCFHEPNPEVNALLKRHYEEVASRFIRAILHALPGLTPDEVFWRMSFLHGAFNHALDMWSRSDWNPLVGIECQLEPNRPSMENLIAQFIVFAAAGIRARSLRLRLMKRKSHLSQ
jgi:AcrR family transcriptional regulator